ncbi:Sulfotransferase [Gryllus bimaculatus]|nr:Sulfotransferase [Gryllus bimaculatus]
MSSKFPFSIERVDALQNEKLLRDFTGERTAFVQVGPDKWFFPRKFESEAEHFYNFEVRSDDTWVVTFPRSGTTWTQEMVWLLANNLDYFTASKIPLVDRFPFLEFSTFVHEDIKRECLEKNRGNKENQEAIESLCQPMYETLKNAPSPRFIKTHLPFSLLPPDLLTKGCKVIYVARNPKDVAVSFYHLNRLIKTQGFLRDFKTYWEYFENNLQPWTPYWTHVLEAWNKRRNENLLFLFYEEMNNDLKSVVEKTANFLKKETSTEDIEILCQHLDIKNFRNNPSVNFSVFKEVGMLTEGEQDFIRKGKNGSYNDLFDLQLLVRANAWINKHLQNSDLHFPEMVISSEAKDKEQTFQKGVISSDIPARQ